MDYKKEYEKWCTDAYFDDATKAELKAIAGDEKEIEDRFRNMRRKSRKFIRRSVRRWNLCRMPWNGYWI